MYSIFCSYEELVNKLLSEADQKEKAAKKLFEEGKYEPVVCFLENMQLADKFVRHDALVVGFKERFKTLTRAIADHICDLETKVHPLLFATCCSNNIFSR